MNEVLRTRAFVLDVAQRTSLARLIGSRAGEDRIHELIAQGTTLLPLSMVLKEVNLLPGTYEGSPAEPADAPALPAPVSRSPAVKELAAAAS